MRSDPRSLLLIPKRGQVNKKRRYRSLRNALRKATESLVDNRSPITIYDTDRGVDIAAVFLCSNGYLTRVYSPRTFNKLWNQP